MKVSIDIRVDAMNEPGAYGQLGVSERFEIEASSFSEIAEILGRFHGLAEKVAKGE